ncbi:hypothetical protein D3C72_1677250 [compost metagenome]
MAGGDERHGDFLADQVLRRLDAVAGDQCFTGANLRGDQEGLDRQLAGGCGGQWAGAQVADLHIAAGYGGDHVGTVVEFAPVDAGLAGFFIVAIDLRHLGRVDGGLVGHGQVGSLGQPAGAGEGQGGEQAQRSVRDHGEPLVRQSM